MVVPEGKRNKMKEREIRWKKERKKERNKRKKERKKERFFFPFSVNFQLINTEHEEAPGRKVRQFLFWDFMIWKKESSFFSGRCPKRNVHCYGIAIFCLKNLYFSVITFSVEWL